MTDDVAKLMRLLSEATPQGKMALRSSKHRSENDVVILARRLSELEINELLRALVACDESPARWNPTWTRVLLQEWVGAALTERMANRAQHEPSSAAECEWRESIAQLYAAWRGTPHPRALLLAWLVVRGHAESWRSFAHHLVTDPPEDAAALLVACAPLWRLPTGPYGELFPGVFAGLAYPHVAPVLFDLSNFLVRSGRVADHPARSRAEQCVTLLGQLVERLEICEAESQRRGITDLNQARQVSESITLAISLCDTLALLGCTDAIGKLYRMLELSHRRLRTEAAAALTRLGETAGADVLVAMAAEPSERLRVLAYARELGLWEKIPSTQRNSVAQAEAELVLRLSERDQMGHPPERIELWDQRELFWPSYDEPQSCLLFRFHYTLGQRRWENVALARPVVQLFACDLSQLPVEDVYALYAGWHVDHEEIYLEPPAAAGDQPVLAQVPNGTHLAEQLAADGWQCCQPPQEGRFLSRRLWVVPVTRDGLACHAVIDETGCLSLTWAKPERGWDTQAVFWWYVGRELLRQFNPAETWDEPDQRGEPEPA